MDVRKQTNQTGKWAPRRRTGRTQRRRGSRVRNQPRPRQNCGECDRVCALPTPVCDGRTCQETCAPGQIERQQACFDANAPPTCGSCDESCQLACGSGTGSCDAPTNVQVSRVECLCPYGERRDRVLGRKRVWPAHPAGVWRGRSPRSHSTNRSFHSFPGPCSRMRNPQQR